MWKSRSHILTPLTTVSSGEKGSKIKWTKELRQRNSKSFPATTLSESQQVMRWRLILEEFGPSNIQHIAKVDNMIVADTLSCLPSANTDREDDNAESLRHRQVGRNVKIHHKLSQISCCFGWRTVQINSKHFLI